MTKWPTAWRLSLMMALVYAVQGSFWPLLAVHLRDIGIDGRARGWIFATMAIASAAVPLGAGQLVDRLMPTQRYLAVSYALGSVILTLLACGVVRQATWLFALFLLYWVIVAPSYGLSNSLAMRHLDDPRRQFGKVRLWGTIGWMGVGFLVSSVMGLTGSTETGLGAYEAFAIATVLAIGLAAYSLTLPQTPPLARGSDPAEAAGSCLRFLRQPDVAPFLLTSFGVSLTTPMVYQVMPAYLESRGLPRAWLASSQTLGQWPEIAALAVLPWMLRRLGTKGTLLLGIAAWFTRFLSLALHPSLSLAVAGTMLHGIGIACFNISGQVHLDSRAPAHYRASVQGLYMVLNTGLAALLGNLLAGELAARTQGDDARVFLVPCVINGVMLIYFLTGFRSQYQSLERAGAASAEPPLRLPAAPGTVCVGDLVTESADG